MDAADNVYGAVAEYLHCHPHFCVEAQNLRILTERPARAPYIASVLPCTSYLFCGAKSCSKNDVFEANWHRDWHFELLPVLILPVPANGTTTRHRIPIYLHGRQKQIVPFLRPFFARFHLYPAQITTNWNIQHTRDAFYSNDCFPEAQKLIYSREYIPHKVPEHLNDNWPFLYTYIKLYLLLPTGVYQSLSFYSSISSNSVYSQQKTQDKFVELASIRLIVRYILIWFLFDCRFYINFK